MSNSHIIMADSEYMIVTIDDARGIRYNKSSPSSGYIRDYVGIYCIPGYVYR